MTATSSAIDELLDGLMFHWGRLPAVADEFPSWDELERLDFLIEWPIQEDDLELLNERVAAGDGTVEQRGRINELLHLVEQNRPILNALMYSAAVPDVAR